MSNSNDEFGDGLGAAAIVAFLIIVTAIVSSCVTEQNRLRDCKLFQQTALDSVHVFCGVASDTDGDTQ